MNADPQSSRTDPRTVVLRQLEAIGRRDMEAVAAEFSDDAQWHIMGGSFLPSGGRFDSKEAIVRDLLSLGGDLFDPATYKLEIKAIYTDGPHVIVEFVIDAMNAKGRHYDHSTYCAVFKVVDGKVAAIREYIDSYKFKVTNID